MHDDERGKFLDSLRKSDGPEGYGKLRWKGALTFAAMVKPIAFSRMARDRTWFRGQFVRVPRSPVATHEQLGLFGKGTTL